MENLNHLDLKTLFSPVKVRMYNLLSNIDRKLCVADMGKILQIHPNHVSYHLNWINKHNILDQYKKEQWIWYKMPPHNKKVFVTLIDAIGPDKTLKYDLEFYKHCRDKNLLVPVDISTSLQRNPTKRANQSI